MEQRETVHFLSLFQIQTIRDILIENKLITAADFLERVRIKIDTVGNLSDEQKEEIKRLT